MPNSISSETEHWNTIDSWEKTVLKKVNKNPHIPWIEISMDFVEGLLLCGGMFVILTVVDRFTKFRHFFSIFHPYTAASIAKVFFDGVFKLHG